MLGRLLAVEFVLIPVSGALAKLCGVGLTPETPWTGLLVVDAVLLYTAVTIWREVGHDPDPPLDNASIRRDRGGNGLLLAVMLFFLLGILMNLFDVVRVLAS